MCTCTIHFFLPYACDSSLLSHPSEFIASYTSLFIPLPIRFIFYSFLTYYKNPIFLSPFSFFFPCQKPDSWLTFKVLQSSAFLKINNWFPLPVTQKNPSQNLFISLTLRNIFYSSIFSRKRSHSFTQENFPPEDMYKFCTTSH